ncbi:MAG: YigZ family protein [Oceanospirillaceae bacterium]|nr:YigZ family protein [Oceanospirillaceae bacterium]MCP5350587.1 YigZ family protein [Oceanospirillaceae bacterium]
MKRFTPTGISTGFYEEKNSKFFAYMSPCTDKTACDEFINDCRKRHPEAGHCCYAYRVDASPQQPLCGYSDDGEPSGTAGKPIFQPLLHGELINVCLVVCRKYGGTQLGTGGLARAYAKAASMAVQAAELREVIPTSILELHTEFHNEAALRRACGQNSADIVASEYQNDRVIVRIEVASERATELKDYLEKLQLLKISATKT